MVIANGEGEEAQLTGSGLTSRVNHPTVIASVISQLREIERRSGIERTLAIGELILRRFFGGDPSAWRDRRRSKSSSLRRLAGRPPCVRTFGHVGASHVTSGLRLDQPERGPLLERAERERLSVRELRQHVVALRRAEGERRGRPSLNGTTRALSSLRHGSPPSRMGSECCTKALHLDAAARAELAEVAAELMSRNAELLALARQIPDVTRAPRESTLRLSKQSA